MSLDLEGRIRAEDAWTRILCRVLAKMLESSVRYTPAVVSVLSKLMVGYRGDERCTPPNDRLNEVCAELRKCLYCEELGVYQQVVENLVDFQTRYLLDRPDHPLLQNAPVMWQLEYWYNAQRDLLDPRSK